MESHVYATDQRIGVEIRKNIVAKLCSPPGRFQAMRITWDVPPRGCKKEYFLYLLGGLRGHWNSIGSRSSLIKSFSIIGFEGVKKTWVEGYVEEIGLERL